MATLKLTSSGGGVQSIDTPSTASNFTSTLPGTTGTLLDTVSSLNSAKLTGALPAISGAALTGIESGVSWQSTIVTASTLTAVAGRGYWINATSNACTITLPSSASVGDQIIFVDYNRSWATNFVEINSNGLKYQGETDALQVRYTVAGQHVNIVYSGASEGWIPVSDEATAQQPVSTTYASNLLVVAGGGGGGRGVGGTAGGGGGGAGGYRTATPTLSPSVVYTVTVGGTAAYDTNGNNSVFSGSGITTITSTGGGAGGTQGRHGANGGSGGGANAGGGGASGTNPGIGNTPSTSPSQGNNGGTGSTAAYTGGAGGGGASAVGANPVNGATAGAAGGAGTANSITGSSVTYAGGGGGGTDTGSSGGAGGAGGGGTGAASNAVGSPGTANTGGGGGGGAVTGSTYGGAGGSGVVILSVATAKYSGTTSGSPTVTTSGGNTIMKFTGSGSYTG